MKKIYTFTLTHSCAIEKKSFAAVLSDAEFKAIKADLHKVRYACGYVTGPKVDNESNYSELVEWLSTTVLYKKETVRLPESKEQILLPEGVYYMTDYLEVCSGTQFESMHTEDSIEELEKCLWVLREFPGARYYKSRVKFKLPSTTEDGNTIKYEQKYSKCKHYLVKTTYNVLTLEVEI